MYKRWWCFVVLCCILQIAIGSSHGAIEKSINKNDIHDKKQNNNRQYKRWRGPVGTSAANNEVSSVPVEQSPVEDIAANSQHSTQYVAECLLPTIWGNFKLRSYRYSSPNKELEPIVIISGDVRGDKSFVYFFACLLYTSPSPRDRQKSRMPSSA